MTTLRRVFCTNLGATFLLLAAAGSAESWAENNHYRWQNSSGETVFSDQPPPTGVKYDAISTTTISPKSVTSDPGDDVPQATESGESRDEDDKKSTELCQTAKMKLLALESNRQLTVRNNKGEAKELSPEEREISRQLAREQIDTFCD